MADDSFKKLVLDPLSGLPDVRAKDFKGVLKQNGADFSVRAVPQFLRCF